LSESFEMQVLKIRNNSWLWTADK